MCAERMVPHYYRQRVICFFFVPCYPNSTGYTVGTNSCCTSGSYSGSIGNWETAESSQDIPKTINHRIKACRINYLKGASTTRRGTQKNLFLTWNSRILQLVRAPDRLPYPAACSGTFLSFFCYTENQERPAFKILIRTARISLSVFAAFLSKNNDESCSQPLRYQRLTKGAYSGAPK